MKYIVTILFTLFFGVGYSQVDQDSTLQERVEELEISSARVYEDGTVRLSRKQFLTMAGALEDPTRLLIKTPGISTANDQANSVIYHGMPAQYHQWSLYGARILNPNHNSNAGTISDLPSTSAGGVNMMSGQVIGSLEFNGNPSEKSLGSLAGISNIKFRNPYKSGLTTNLSLIGLEAGYDKKFGKDNLMVNYRYSTVGVLTGLGLDFGGERINYQDLTTKYSMKRRSGDYSFYLTAGANSTRKDSFERALVTEFKDLQKSDYEAKILIGGMNHSYTNDKYEINTTINGSRRVVDKKAEANIPINSNTEYKNRATLVSLNHNYTRKLGGWKIGYQVESWLEDQFLFKFFPSDLEGLSIERKINRTSLSFQPTINVGVDLLRNLTLHSTLGVTTQYTGENLIDVIGHIGIKYQVGELNVNLSASRAAQNQAIELALDSFSLRNNVSNNVNLDIRYKGFGVNIFRHHLEGLSQRGSRFEIISLQNLDNLPLVYDGGPNNIVLSVDKPVIQGFSLYTDHSLMGININSNLTLQNSRAGYGFGIASGYSILPMDYRFILNTIASKEWSFRSKKKFGISASVHMRGGETQLSISKSSSKEWGYTEFIHSVPPQIRLSDYYRADLRIYYKPSKRSTISLDIQNVTNRQNDAFYYYEPLTGESTLRKQLGLIPILSWRVDW